MVKCFYCDREGDSDNCGEDTQCFNGCAELLNEILKEIIAEEKTSK